MFKQALVIKWWPMSDNVPCWVTRRCHRGHHGSHLSSTGTWTYLETCVATLGSWLRCSALLATSLWWAPGRSSCGVRWHWSRGTEYCHHLHMVSVLTYIVVSSCSDQWYLWWHKRIVEQGWWDLYKLLSWRATIPVLLSLFQTHSGTADHNHEILNVRIDVSDVYCAEYLGVVLDSELNKIIQLEQSSLVQLKNKEGGKRWNIKLL